jgi:hypothetical protein
MATAVLPSPPGHFGGDERSAFHGFPLVHDMHVVDASGDDVHVHTAPAHGPGAQVGPGKLAVPAFVHSRAGSGPPPPSPPASVEGLALVESPAEIESTGPVVRSRSATRRQTLDISPWEFHP